MGRVRPLPFFIRAVLNVVTTGNGTGTKNVLKWNRAFGFEFSIHPIFCLWRYYCSEISLFSTRTRSTVSFYSILLASERSERDTLSRSSMENAIRIYIYIYI